MTTRARITVKTAAEYYDTLRALLGDKGALGFITDLGHKHFKHKKIIAMYQRAIRLQTTVGWGRKATTYVWIIELERCGALKIAGAEREDGNQATRTDVSG